MAASTVASAYSFNIGRTNGEYALRFLREGESITVNPLVHHNIYLSSNSVTHTIKYGSDGTEIDWFPSENLDKFTKKLSENDLLELSIGIS